VETEILLVLTEIAFNLTIVIIGLTLIIGILFMARIIKVTVNYENATLNEKLTIIFLLSLAIGILLITLISISIF